MVSLVDSLDEKYGEDEEEDQDFGFIVFVSSSPEAKSGLLPPIITLNDYNIECVGDHLALRLNHIAELDLTDNLLSDWSEVVNILTAFPRLYFLNLSNNLLNQPIDTNSNKLANIDNANLNMRKLVLNGNNVNWSTVIFLSGKMERLEELHLSTNNLNNLGNNIFKHEKLRLLYLSCNPISDFRSLSRNLVSQCPNLEMLSVAECPVSCVPCPGELDYLPSGLHSLNLSTTKLNSWEEVDKLRQFPGLVDLRIQGCPFLEEFTAHERRMMLISRLPNIRVLNGGDGITHMEREDAERAFIRYFLDTPGSSRPPRFQELVEVHGLLEPLVNIDLTPEVNILVKIYYGEETREERISVRQTVKQFKQYLQNIVHIAPANMRVYYYDQELSKLVGPEEMKWGSKELYTYNVREGDYFVVDERAKLRTLKTSNSSSSNSNSSSTGTSPKGMFGSLSPKPSGTKGYTGLGARTGQNLNFGGHSPGGESPSTSPNPRFRRSSGGGKPTSERKSCKSPNGKSSVSRNLFGSNSNNSNNSNNSSSERFGEFHYSKVFHDTG